MSVFPGFCPSKLEGGIASFWVNVNKIKINSIRYTEIWTDIVIHLH